MDRLFERAAITVFFIIMALIPFIVAIGTWPKTVSYVMIGLGIIILAFMIPVMDWAISPKRYAKRAYVVQMNGDDPQGWFPSMVKGVSWTTCLTLTMLPGEQVIWSGRPERRSYLMTIGRQSIYRFLAIIPIATVFVIGGLMIAVPIIFFGAFLLALAILPIIGTYRKKTREWPQTTYRITDKRILVSEGIGKCKFIELLDLTEVIIFKNYADQLNGTGSIIITDTRGVDLCNISSPEHIKEVIERSIIAARKSRFDQWSGTNN